MGSLVKQPVLFLQLAFAASLVGAIVVLTITGHANEQTTSNLGTILTIVIGSIFGYATARGISTDAAELSAHNTAQKIEKKLNGLVSEIAANSPDTEVH